MTRCIQCGKEAQFCLCDECTASSNIENLCMEILSYNDTSEQHPLWSEIRNSLESADNFKYIAFALSDGLPSPRKEFIRVLSLMSKEGYVSKASRPWFYGIYDCIRDNDSLSIEEKCLMDGIALHAFSGDYQYEKAEKTVSRALSSDCIPWQVYRNIAEFYCITRRYEMAENLLQEAFQKFRDIEYAISCLNKIAKTNDDRRKKAAEGKPEYLPNPEKNKEEIRKRYIDFLSSIGIEAALPAHPAKKIPKDQYPEPIEIKESSFSTFVAFDLETTGRNSAYDDIIEIGAIKVVDGEVIDTQEFCFQEFVYPMDSRKIPQDVIELTGITPDDIRQARKIQAVLPDFMQFVGDNVLVGFNCMAFDSRFLVRAGRHSNTIIRNYYFDVMHYASRFKDMLDVEMTNGRIKLEVLSEKLNIPNPHAHRALADALTTARIYLKLKSMEVKPENQSISDLLSDLDDWV